MLYKVVLETAWSIDLSPCFSPSISPCHTHSFTLSAPLLFDTRCLLPAALCSQSHRLILLSPLPAPLYTTSSSHISVSLSLTCPLSHAHAQPRSSFLYHAADSIHSSSSPPPPLPLAYTISPTLKLSYLTSFRNHAVLAPLHNSGFKKKF